MKYTITAEQAETRIDSFLSQQFEDVSRSRIQSFISEAKVNNKSVKKNYKLEEDDILEFKLPEVKPLDLEAIDKPLNILYEDDDILVIDKPPFLPVHPDKKRSHSETLVNLLLGNKIELSDLGGEDRPGIVHRLDMDTSGAIIVAKTNKAYAHLRQQFENREVKKTYIALAIGKLSPDKGKIEAPIGRDNKDRKRMAVTSNKSSKQATTEYEVLENPEHKDFKKGFSLLKVNIPTGRTHQIRVHLQAIQHPIIGDQTYGNSKANHIAEAYDLSRQFLHAVNIKFKNLDNELISVTSKLSPDLKGFLETLGSEIKL